MDPGPWQASNREFGKNEKLGPLGPIFISRYKYLRTRPIAWPAKPGHLGTLPPQVAGPAVPVHGEGAHVNTMAARGAAGGTKVATLLLAVGALLLLLVLPHVVRKVWQRGEEGSQRLHTCHQRG